MSLNNWCVRSHHSAQQVVPQFAESLGNGVQLQSDLENQSKRLDSRIAQLEIVL